MCLKKLIELIAHRNSNLGDLRESGIIKFLKFRPLFTFDFFYSHVLWIFLNYTKGILYFNLERQLRLNWKQSKVLEFKLCFCERWL